MRGNLGRLLVAARIRSLGDTTGSRIVLWSGVSRAHSLKRDLFPHVSGRRLGEEIGTTG